MAKSLESPVWLSFKGNRAKAIANEKAFLGTAWELEGEIPEHESRSEALLGSPQVRFLRLYCCTSLISFRDSDGSGGGAATHATHTHTHALSRMWAHQHTYPAFTCRSLANEVRPWACQHSFRGQAYVPFNGGVHLP